MNLLSKQNFVELEKLCYNIYHSVFFSRTTMHFFFEATTKIFIQTQRYHGTTMVNFR